MKTNFDSIIFDIDGVLIDVRKSFHLANQKTAQYVLKNKYGLSVKVKEDDITAMKNISGFNNDWDLTFALVNLLSKNIKRNEFEKYAVQLPKNIRDNVDYKEIRAISETYYWGDKIFSKLYNQLAPFRFNSGFVNNESLLIKEAILKKLSSSYFLGIVTGRTKFETAYSLNKLKIMSFFKEDFIVTEEDTIETKPDPAPLLEAKKRMKVKNPIYVGDTINDVIAAKKAEMTCVYVGKEKLGDFQIKDINEIKEILL